MAEEKNEELLETVSNYALDALADLKEGTDEYEKVHSEAVELYKLRQEDEKIKISKIKLVVEAGLGIVTAAAALVPAVLNKVNMDNLIMLEEGGKEIVSKAFQFVSKGVR